MTLNNSNICLAHESECGQSSVGNRSTLFYFQVVEKLGKLEAVASEGSLLMCMV